MPQIPVVNESQAMNVNSPVAIGNADTSMMSAVNQLGGNLVKLGEKIDEAQRAQRARADKNNLEIAGADYWQAQNQIKEEALLDESGKPRSAKEANLYLIKKGDEIRQQYIKDREMDSNTALEFTAKTKEIDNHFTASLVDSSTKLNNSYAKETEQQKLLKKGSIISSDPSMLSGTLVDIETSVNADKTILNKPEAIRKNQAVVFEAAIASSLSGSNYKGAKAFLDQGMKLGVYEPDEAEKKLSAIRTAQHAENTEWRASQTTGRQIKKDREKDALDRASDEFMMQVQFAGNDPARLDAAVIKLQANPDVPQSFRIAAISSVKKETGIDLIPYRYEANFKNDLFTGKKSTDEARASINNEFQKGQLPIKRMVELSKIVQRTEEFQKNNPSGYKAAQEYANQLQGYFTPDRKSPNASFANAENEQTKAAALSSYWEEVHKRNSQGALAVSDLSDIVSQVRVRAGKGAAASSKIPPGASESDFINLDSATKWMQKFQEKIKREPNVSVEEKRKRIQQKVLADKQILMLQQREQRTNQPTPPKEASVRRAFDD